MGPIDQDDRFDRLERKVDDLTEAVVTLARIEERTVTLFRDQASTSEAVGRLGARLATLETMAAQNGVTIQQGERLFWVMIAFGSSICSSVAVYYLTKGL